MGLETCWPALRDPDFDELQQIIHKRQAAAPGRPLFIVLGSSRTQLALRAEWLNQPGNPSAPVVVNCAIAGAGPMMHQVVLQRLLRAGLKPQMVFVECMPLSLSARKGSPIEERHQSSGRFTAGEAVNLHHYFNEPYHLWYPWTFARLLPCHRHQSELRFAFGIDRAHTAPLSLVGRDEYGWSPCRTLFSTEEIERKTNSSLKAYMPALTQPALAPGALQALRDVVNLCRDNHIPVVFFAPAEASCFRSYAPAVAENQMNALRSLTHENSVPLIDSRAWIDDPGYYDGHHATRQGADQYTLRFQREVLARYLSPQSTSTAGPVVYGGNSRAAPVRRNGMEPEARE
jgi:hypothetical protein